MNKALFTGLAFFTLFSLVVASPPSQAETYTYDNAGRLSSVTYDDNTTINYTYDANGNVLAMAASTVAQGGGSTTNQNTNTTAG